MSSYAAAVPRPPRTLARHEQDRLLKVTGEHRDGFRDHVIFSLALGTALREHELTGLDVGDILLEDGRVRRRIKLRIFKRSTLDPVNQEVFLPDAAWYKLTKFISWKRGRGESLDPTAPLFVSRLSSRIATRTLRYLFKIWQARAGFDQTFTFHQLRHTALTNVYRDSGDVLRAQRVARHKNVNTTQIYAHPSDEDIVRAVRDLPC